jgi:Family of unknown function (DUF6763)
MNVNAGVGAAQIGQWYRHWDKGEMFQVTALDPESKTIEIQTFDGDIDEIDAESWSTLPLGLAEPPEDWTGPVDAVNVDEVTDSETGTTAKDWEAPLQALPAAAEAWENPIDSAEDDPEGDVASPSTEGFDGSTRDEEGRRDEDRVPRS